MSELEVVPLPNGQFGENCWLLADARTGEAVMIDPGEEPQMFLAELNTRGWSLGGIWITHGHIDHILGVAAVKRATGAPIYLHPADRPLYDSLTQQGSWFGLTVDPLPPPDRDLEAGQRLDVGGIEFTVRHTPGHSPGSIALVCDEAHVAITGDALFAGSVGRTDFPGCDFETLERSIRTKLYTLPPETRIYPGHGPETTIGREMRSNPYVRG